MLAKGERKITELTVNDSNLTFSSSGPWGGETGCTVKSGPLPQLTALQGPLNLCSWPHLPGEPPPPVLGFPQPTAPGSSSQGSAKPISPSGHVHCCFHGLQRQPQRSPHFTQVSVQIPCLHSGPPGNNSLPLGTPLSNTDGPSVRSIHLRGTHAHWMPHRPTCFLVYCLSLHEGISSRRAGMGF